MIEVLKTKKKYALAINVVDGFTVEDEDYCEHLFQKKLDKGYKQINLLIRLDNLRLTKISLRAFMKDLYWILRNYKRVGHMAIVAHSRIIKAWIRIDNLFFEKASAGRYERYFDVSEMKEAMAFIHARV